MSRRAERKALARMYKLRTELVARLEAKGISLEYSPWGEASALAMFATWREMDEDTVDDPCVSLTEVERMVQSVSDLNRQILHLERRHHLRMVLARKHFAPATARPSYGLRAAALIFRTVQAVIPRRVADEEIGDALEEIARHVEGGGSRIWVAFKVISTVVYLLAHGARYALKGESKKRSE
jgi:hypothetical protein